MVSILSCALSQGTARVSWFVDGQHLGTTASTERPHWTPTPGRHEIVVTDEVGRKARRTLDVKLGSS